MRKKCCSTETASSINQRLNLRQCPTFTELLNFNIDPKLFKFLLNDGIKIEEYWKQGHAEVSVQRELVKNKHPYAKCFKGKNNVYLKDFKGLYIFCTTSGIPFYVGISQNVILRINQHIKGNTHNSASLAYLICTELYPSAKKKTRDNFPFNEHRTAIQDYLKGQKVVLMKIDNDDELYLREFQFAIELRTYFNSFVTH